MLSIWTKFIAFIFGTPLNNNVENENVFPAFSQYGEKKFRKLIPIIYKKRSMLIAKFINMLNTHSPTYILPITSELAWTLIKSTINQVFI